MVIEISEDAAAFIRGHGGRVWVWSARPRMCCAGPAPLMHAATSAPAGLSGFTAMPLAAEAAGVQVYFRARGDSRPGVLEIALPGRRRPRIEAYWDGCLMAMP
jgi:hypothetical protein